MFHGTRAAVHHVFAQPTLEGLSVLVQGVGDVGYPLAKKLADDGARILLCDMDSKRADKVAKELGGEVTPPEDLYTTDCGHFRSLCHRRNP